MEENPEHTVENFAIVSCAEVKQESEECDYREVSTFEEISIPECDVDIKEEVDEVSTFEEISIPDCDVQIKEEVDETAALAASPDLERDPLKVEGEEETAALAASPVLERDPLKVEGEEEVDAAGWSGLDSNRLAQDTTMGHTVSSDGAQLEGTLCDELEEGATDDTQVVSCGPSSQGLGRQNSHPSRSPPSRNDYGDSFACSACSQTFSTKFALTMHVFSHMNGVEPPVHICRLCGEVFPIVDSFHSHTSIHCLRAESGYGQDKMSSHDMSFVLTENDVSQTVDCNFERSSDDIEQSNSPQGSLPAPEHTRNGHGRYLCNICNISFRSPHRFELHLNEHLVSGLYKCGDCGRSFKQPFNLKQHALSHTGEKTHVCACGRLFALLSSLKRHAVLHTGEKPYTCDVCFKSFTNAYLLKRHIVTHTGERWHACDECGRCFKRLDHLKQHALCHTREKPHICACGKSFSRLYSLKRHTLIHKGEKPCTCDVCLKSFTNALGLKRHVAVHTGERPYACSDCGRSFKEVCHLKQHLELTAVVGRTCAVSAVNVSRSRVVSTGTSLSTSAGGQL